MGSLLTDELRQHRLEEFERMLPLVKETLDDSKESIRLSQRIKNYEKHKEELEGIILSTKELLSSDLFNSYENCETEIKILRKRKNKLEEELKKTEEFIADFKKEKVELDKKISYYKNYFEGVVMGICFSDEPILDGEKVDIQYIREYFYLVFVHSYYRINGFSKNTLFSQSAINKINSYVIENLSLEKESLGATIIECLTSYANISSTAELLEIFN